NLPVAAVTVAAHEVVRVVERVQARELPDSERARFAVVVDAVGLRVQRPAEVVRVQLAVGEEVFAAQGILACLRSPLLPVQVPRGESLRKVAKVASLRQCEESLHSVL